MLFFSGGTAFNASRPMPRTAAAMPACGAKTLCRLSKAAIIAVFACCLGCSYNSCTIIQHVKYPVQVAQHVVQGTNFNALGAETWFKEQLWRNLER